MRYPRRSPNIRTGSTRPERSSHRAAWPGPTRLSAARDAAVGAVSRRPEQQQRRPAGAFTEADQADADLDRLLAAVAEEREATERSGGPHDQALFTAQSRVRSVSDYVEHPPRQRQARPAPSSTGRTPAAG